jgi:hypothetical protein
MKTQKFKPFDNWREQVETLSKDQQQLLKDTIIYGSWGDGEETFLNKDGEPETDWMYGYFTNDAYKGHHFHSQKLSGLFSSLIKTLCPKQGRGQFFSHCSDWWGDGTGDMLFVRHSISDEVEAWAKEQ